MKALILALALFSTPVFARQVRLDSSCNINRSYAACAVFNHLNQAVYCDMRISGVSRYGIPATVYAQGWVYPGQTLNGQIYSYNPYNDPIVRAHVSSNCRF